MRSGEATIMRLFEAMDHRDEAALRALTTDDFTMTWPQSGERFRGREDSLGALSVQDDAPTPVGEPRIVGGGDTWVVMMPLRYAEAGDVHYVGVFELREGRVRASTEYFGSPFPAKPERARFTELS
jgi:ketosteroid isomerase-like protein